MDNSKLHILWINDNPITVELMLMMYGTNSMKRQLWKEVHIIIWGASAKLIAEDTHIQELVTEAMNAGVEFSVCAGCADKLGIRQALFDLGIEGKRRIAYLTELIKNNENLITV